MPLCPAAWLNTCHQSVLNSNELPLTIYLVFLLDLNHRSWNMLHDYYSDVAKAIHPTWLGQSPQEILSWSARFEV
jgi:hypothetical protein